MIIKSMRRKTPSFTQLIGYFHKTHYDRSAPVFSHNLYDSNTPENAADEFEHNATFLPKRANGNYLYHEIIALEDHPEISRPKQERILLDLVRRYIAIRAPKQLVYGRMHLDKHLHFHLCISANAARGKQRLWLSKSRFANIQSELERYKLEKYPELGNRELYARPERSNQFQTAAFDRKFFHKKQREFEYSRRTGERSRKEALRELLLPIFAQAVSFQSLRQELIAHQISLYQRGKTRGLVDDRSGKRYRLKTLGLDFAAFVVEERERAAKQNSQIKILERPEPHPRQQ